MSDLGDRMERNAANLRSKHHKVLAWSIAAAVAIHVGVFVLAPEFDVEPLGGLDGENNVGDPMPILAPRVLSVFFGPPSIAMPDGSEWQEPDDRVLEAVRVTEFPPECATNARARLTQQRGSVRLRVNQGGRAAVIDLVEGTGDPCGDRLLKSVAGALRYHWLPNTRFPAPVELVQPLTLAEGPS